MTYRNVDFNSLNGAQLVLTYNELVNEAVTSGLEGYRPVSRFADKVSAVKRCEALASSLRARAQGFAEDPAVVDHSIKAIVQRATGGMVKAAGYDPETGEDVPPVPPGRARLLADPANAETLRQQVLVDQQRATEGAARMEEFIEEVVEKPVKKQKKAKEPKVAKAPSGRRSRITEDHTITVLIEANPKREGSRGYELFSLYETGMPVGVYFERSGDKARALSNLKWDVAKGYVTVN